MQLSNLLQSSFQEKEVVGKREEKLKEKGLKKKVISYLLEKTFALACLLPLVKPVALILLLLKFATLLTVPIILDGRTPGGCREEQKDRKAINNRIKEKKSRLVYIFPGWSI